MVQDIRQDGTRKVYIYFIQLRPAHWLVLKIWFTDRVKDYTKILKPLYYTFRIQYQWIKFILTNYLSTGIQGMVTLIVRILAKNGLKNKKAVF